MGNAETKERLGERVKAAREKFENSRKEYSSLLLVIDQKTSNVKTDVVEFIRASFANHAPFSEATLMMAWHSNPTETEKIILNACKHILDQPVDKLQFKWLADYVLDSSVWFFKTSKDEYLFKYLLDITQEYSKEIVDDMDLIYQGLQNNVSWSDLMSIENHDIITRQDHKTIGLLQEKTIQDFRVNQSEQKDEKKEEELKNFVDTNFAINVLLSSAKAINDEFQQHVAIILSKHGQVKAGPLKKMERCLSKVEQDYFEEPFPRCASMFHLIWVKNVLSCYR